MKQSKRRQAMKIRAGWMVVTMLAAAAATTALAQSSGADTYKAKCQSCHGAEGTPNPGIAKMMGVKPASDPSVKSLSEAVMITDTTNGKGKMPAFKGKLTESQIKDSVAYFRSLAK
jgi:mono/diheme cytochrome c family protein